MIRWLGVACLAVGAAGVGLAAARRLERRVRDVRTMMYAMESLEHALSFHMPPMSALLEAMERRWTGPAGAFFAACRRDLDKLDTCSMGDIWRDNLRRSALELEEEDRSVLEEVGDILGRYDGERQRESLAQARQRLGVCLERAAERREKLTRVYAALALAAGGMLAVVLL